MRLTSLLPTAALVALTIAACDTAPDDGAGENELITAVTLTLTPTGGGTAATATYRDANGDGLVQSSEFTTLALRAGTTYTGSVTFADGSDDITAEVRSESDAHQVLYTVGGGAAGRLTVTAADSDANGKPIGLSTTAAVTTGAAASGTLRVVLAHYDPPSTKAAGVASGETDFDGTFPVTIAP